MASATLVNLVRSMASLNWIRITALSGTACAPETGLRLSMRGAVLSLVVNEETVSCWRGRPTRSTMPVFTRTVMRSKSRNVAAGVKVASVLSALKVQLPLSRPLLLLTTRLVPLTVPACTGSEKRTWIVCVTGILPAPFAGITALMAGGAVSSTSLAKLTTWPWLVSTAVALTIPSPSGSVMVSS